MDPFEHDAGEDGERDKDFVCVVMFMCYIVSVFVLRRNAVMPDSYSCCHDDLT